MSNKELNRLDIIKAVLEKRLKQKDAAIKLGITFRHVSRLKSDYLMFGASALISKRRGKLSNRAFKPEIKAKAIKILHSQYPDFGPTLASEKLGEKNELKINKETIRQWMMAESLWKGKKRKSCIVHQQRARRACLGELVQIDGSPHAWFEERGPECCLLVFIDDATSEIMHLYFVPVESTLGYFEGTEQYIRQHGRPLAFYSDKHSIFRVNQKEADSGTGESQFERALRELGIDLICANTPQAKGRVERANSTLQDRLVKELRLENISDIASANAFLPTFIKALNQKFSKPPKSPENAHRKNLPDDETLAMIFTHQDTRTLSKNLELSYNNVIYQIQIKNNGYNMRKAKVRVCDDLKGNITLLYKGKKLNYKTLDKNNRPLASVSKKEINQLLSQKAKQDGRNKGNKPSNDHPWKKSYKQNLRKAG